MADETRSGVELGADRWVTLFGEQNLPAIRAVRKVGETEVHFFVYGDECTDVERIGAAFVRWAEFMLEPTKRERAGIGLGKTNAAED